MGFFFRIGESRGTFDHAIRFVNVQSRGGEEWDS